MESERRKDANPRQDAFHSIGHAESSELMGDFSLLHTLASLF